MKSIYQLIPGILFLCTACNKQTFTDYPAEEKVVDAVYVHRYGVTVTPEDWSERGKDGQVIATLDNGVVVTQNFIGGVLEGKATYTFPHSKVIHKIESYQQGELVNEVEHYCTGIPMQERTKIAPNHYKVTVWDEKGIPQSLEEYHAGLLTRGEYFNNTHQLESKVDSGEGIKIVRDPYGQLICKDTIQGGERVLSTTYYPNESPKELIPFCHGKIEGEKKSYLPSGEPNTIEQWVAGEQHGVTVLFKNGGRYAEETYHHGVKEGIERYYEDDGMTIAKEFVVKDHKKHH